MAKSTSFLLVSVLQVLPVSSPLALWASPPPALHPATHLCTNTAAHTDSHNIWYDQLHVEGYLENRSLPSWEKAINVLCRVNVKYTYSHPVTHNGLTYTNLLPYAFSIIIVI